MKPQDPMRCLLSQNGWSALHLLCKNKDGVETGDLADSIQGLMSAKADVNAKTTVREPHCLLLLESMCTDGDTNLVWLAGQQQDCATFIVRERIRHSAGS